MSLLSLWATALLENTLPQVLRLWTGIALYYALANWGNSFPRLRWLIVGVTLAGAALALSAPFSMQWSLSKLSFIPPSIYERFVLLFKDTIHPSVMAGYLIILYFIPLSLLLFTWKKLRWYEWLLCGFAILAMSGVLLLTKSRGAFVALGVALIVMALLRWRRSWIVLLAGVVIALLFYKLVPIPFIDTLARNSLANDAGIRLRLYLRAIFIIQDFPLTGVGMGNFWEAADGLYSFFLQMAPESVQTCAQLYLQIAVDLGIPGLIGWLGTFFALTAACWQLYRFGRQEGNRWAAGLGAGLLCGQVALAVHGLVDAIPWGLIRAVPIAWAFWGLVVVAYRTLILTNPTIVPPMGSQAD
jgi:putative inorganic carbon (HCO3(-)) transporter